MSAGKGDAPRNCFSDQYRANYDTIFSTPNNMKQKTADSNKWQRANVQKRAKQHKQPNPMDIYDDIEEGYQHFVQKRMRLKKADR